MRHLRSILYALVLAPAAWVLAGVGLTDELHGRGRQYSGVESFSGLLLLLLAGAAYAILVFAPISPAGPTLFGLIFVGAGGWALAAPSSYASIWPSGVTKPGFDLSRPGYGLAALLAVPLICTALSVRRWQRYEPPLLPLIGTWGRPRGAASVAGTPAAESTQIIPQAGLNGDATQVIRAAKAPPEPAAETTEVCSSEEPTAVSAPEEPTADVVGTESVAADPTTADPTTADPTTADEPTVVEAERAEDAQAQQDAEAEPTEAGAEDVEPEKRSVGERTATITAGDQEKTQIIRLPVGELPTREIRVSPGERTQVISRDRIDETQVIRVPHQRTESTDGERTQVIRLNAGTVEPPADRTQVLRLPPAPGQGTTEETAPREAAPAKPARPPSIVAQERPDPGADPTTRLGVSPPAPAAQPAPATRTDLGDRTTADVGNGKRAMTVMNLERPAGEAADDPRPLRPSTPPAPDKTA